MALDNLAGKLAVVTGASRGIGLHIARALCEAQARVVITGRNESTLSEAAAGLGSRCRPIVCEQRNPGAIQEMAQDVCKNEGWPDILVNNAGMFKGGFVKDMPLTDWNEVVETNLTGVFLTSQAFLPGMIERGRGDVFMISSMSGKKGDAGAAAYAASKFGLQGFAQALNYEVRKHNIRIMVLNPSSVETGSDDGPEHGKGLRLHATDIAATVVHLACLPGRTLIRDMDIWGTNPA